MQSRVTLAAVAAFSFGALDYSKVNGEDVDTAWVRYYDGPAAKTDNAYAIAEDDSGYVYLAGSAQAQSGMFHTGSYPDNEIFPGRRHGLDVNLLPAV